MHAAPYRRIPLRNRDGSVVAHALVSPEDYADLSRFKWHRHCVDGYAQRCFYDKRAGKPRIERMHRRLLDLHRGDGQVVDHINRNRLDNRRSNLRLVTSYGNATNRSAQGGVSKHRGVYLDKRKPLSGKPWHARVMVRGRALRLGYFHREEDAAEAARRARVELGWE